MWYRTGRGEGVSFCSSTVGECRPTWLWLPGIETWIRIRRAERSALLGAWDERNGGSASGETRLVEVETKEDHQHRGLREGFWEAWRFRASVWTRGEATFPSIRKMPSSVRTSVRRVCVRGASDPGVRALDLDLSLGGFHNKTTRG